MKRAWIALATMATATTMAATLVPSPAQAAGSVIDIGVTIYEGGYVKGSGSTTNNGDYTNVCLVIMGNTSPGTPGSIFHSGPAACKSQIGQWVWSAPPQQAGGGACAAYYTRITAYKNGNSVANKNSNTIYIGNC
ncbi:hypothetical protein GCM10027280_29050 [Micromonospora polyrhachis]|uniref:Uncharacterized protein n=1 Tax=Micromonospora polyrhachis TaxID=1282883 RepID=A0A7W7SQK0_9ACTN|nr:hypothetical protein [Micromonospora polyrhachis]